MRPSSFARELIRSITRKPGRFIALMAIVALGAGFYAGLRMTAPDMKIALDRYFDSNYVYDIRVVGTYGMTDDDAASVASIEGVEAVMTAYEVDAVALFGESSYTVRMHSIPESAFGIDGQPYMNRVELVEGRWPETADECVVSSERVTGAACDIGDEIVLVQGAVDLDDTLATKTFHVTGKVRSSYYVSSANLDSSTLGSGVVQQVLFVRENAFSEDTPYSELFVIVDGAADLNYPSDAYNELVDEVTNRISAIADERCAIRLDEVRDQLFDKAMSYEGLLDLAEYRLSKSHDEFADPDMPEWLIMNRDKSAGTISFCNDSDRIDHIARVFPFMFFLVAALVALTTMTRMVDEERMLAGTYKALGYSKAKIASKYLIYGGLASVIGSIIGIAVLARLLPGVIMNAYAIMYIVPTVELPINGGIAFLSAGLLTAITLGTTGVSIAATVRERPASLMLPKTAAKGKRIILERIGPLWRRLSFTWKVTFRNILRYKKRFIMTLIGIAGCTALLLTGLGLHNAVNDIIDVQFGELIKHNTVVTLKDHMSSSDESAFAHVINDGNLVEAKTDAYAEGMLASGAKRNDIRVELIVPHDPEAFQEMRSMRTRVTHDEIDLNACEVAVSEKLAHELGIGIGDTIVLHKQDAMGNATSTAYEYTIGAIVENYISNYVFVTDGAYEAAVGAVPPRNTVFANVADTEAREGLESALSDIDGVKTLAFNDELLGTYRTMLRSVDLIVVVLVISAAALAFIVLYNLTNINIEERIREIATLKVLGFLPRETNAYIFREIAIIALLGCLVGLVLGTYLESFVVETAEVDAVMFGRSIHPPSYIAAFVMTMVFSAASMLLMLPKLKHVDMVESLKSNE